MQVRSAAFCLLMFAFLFSEAQQSKVCQKASVLLKLFEKYHFQPVEMNEKTSKEVFDDLIAALDPKGLLFTTADIASLASYKAIIPAQINSGNCAFFKAVSDLYKKKLIYADTLIGYLAAKPLDYNANEVLDVNAMENAMPDWPKTNEALVTKWYLYMKYEILHLMAGTVAKDSLLDPKHLLKNEPVLRGKIKANEKKQIQRILNAPKGFENYVANIFLNTLAKRFDPHSVYMNPEDKEDFISLVSRDGLSYGFYTDENKHGEIEITHLIPGGNAWKSNQVNIGDILVRLKFENKKPTEIFNMENDEVTQLFAMNNDSRRMEMTVRKPNGILKTVNLQKEKTEEDQNIVKSYILNGSKKIGYISLPSFYSDWDSDNPLGCGNDVAKEIDKLQQEKIEGLILDLRYNGGGSMMEAINLAGIFISEGPLGAIKVRNEKPLTIKDMNRGTAYDGPLLVMVNGCSASASEMVSAVLQDYNRAIIVGNPTYGKATGQSTYPLDLSYDPSVPGQNGSSDLGYINITNNKFYRVTSLSHQKHGVVPDIIVPDIFLLSIQKEANEKYVMPSDTVLKTLYYSALEPLPKAALKSKSEERVRQSTFFKSIVTLNDSMLAMEKQGSHIPLNIHKYIQMRQKHTFLETAIEGITTTSGSSYKAVNNQSDKKVFQVNEFSSQMNDAFLKKLESDIHLDESYRILCDLIQIKP